MRTFLCVLSDFIGLKQICKISLFANTLNSATATATILKYIFCFSIFSLLCGPI